MENGSNFSIFDDNASEETYEITSEIVNDEEVVISDDVIAAIASKAAMSLAAVHSMSSSAIGDIIDMFGVNSQTKGVTVSTKDDTTVIDVYVIVNYGQKFSDIAWDIQETVKSTVENMTGITVESVNVHVQGVTFDDKNEEKIQ